MEIFRQAAHTADATTACSPFDPVRYAQSRCDAYNAMAGHLAGENCPICRNKGRVVYLGGADGTEEITRECSCMAARESRRRMETSGLGGSLETCAIQSYQAAEGWQRKILAAAHAYLDDHDGKWWYIGGQVGAGKTHICTAITGELLRQGKEARYMLWKDEATEIKAVVNDGAAYRRKTEPLKEAPVLYIDDFWKTGGKDERGRKKYPTPAEINLAFEIINSRYNRRDLITILSSEWTVSELMDIDPATGSRIYQRTKDYHFTIGQNPARNWRMREG